MTETTETTEIPEGRQRGIIHIIARCLSPLRHAQGVEGNIQMFRRRRMHVDGAFEEVPFVSGNSIKSWLRRHAALFAIQAAGLDDGRLTRDQVQLLFAGGVLSSGGQALKLDEARRLGELVPALAMHGYAAGNMITESLLRVSHLEVASYETRHHVRAPLERYAPAYLDRLEQRAASYLEEDFGTRRVPEHQEHVQRLLDGDARDELEVELIERNEGGGDKSTQMIYQHEVLMPGAVLVGSVGFPHGLTPMEVQSLRSAFTHASCGRTAAGELICHLGARSAAGYGKVAMTLHGELAQGVEAWRHEDTDALSPAREEGEGFDEGLAGYVTHLRAHRDEIQEAMDALI